MRQPRTGNRQGGEREAGTGERRLLVVQKAAELAVSNQRERRRESCQLYRVQLALAPQGEVSERNAGEQRCHGNRYQRESHAFGLWPLHQQQQADGRGNCTPFAQFRLAPAEEGQCAAHEQVEPPCERRVPTRIDQDRELDAGYTRRSQPQDLAEALVGDQGRNDGAEHQEIQTERDDVAGREIAGREQQRAPAEPADECGDAEPRAILPLARKREAGGDEAQIQRQQRNVGSVAADQRRCRETSDEAEYRAGQSEAERQGDRHRRHCCQAHESDQLADQPVLGSGEVEACIERREACAGECLLHPLVRDLVLEPARNLCAADQTDPEQECHDDPYRWRQQTGIDRIADEEHPGDGEGHPAAPDRQLAAEDVLEIETQLRRGKAGSSRALCAIRDFPGDRLRGGFLRHLWGGAGAQDRRFASSLRDSDRRTLRHCGGFAGRLRARWRCRLAGYQLVAGDQIAQAEQRCLVQPVERVEPLLGPIQPVPQICGNSGKAEDEQPFHRLPSGKSYRGPADAAQSGRRTIPELACRGNGIPGVAFRQKAERPAVWQA